MKNKILLIIIVVLVPIFISSFKKETTFLFHTKQYENNVTYNNEIIKMDDYVLGVLAGEMPALFNEEALKAQAIAIRTYTIYKNKNMTTLDQRYITIEEMKNKWLDNYEEYYTKLLKIITETNNYIITYNEQPIKAFYFSKSNGYTEDSMNVFNESFPYLKSVSSPEEIIEEEIILDINIINNIFNVFTINNIIKNETNRIDKIIINNETYKGTEIRKLLNLKSTDFNIETLDDQIKIITKGYGHGVGMSQYGANELAKQGYTFEQIIKYYYQNVEITSIK
jgi:stage II sporulation protein D